MPFPPQFSEAPLGYWTFYTPSWTGDGTNPAIGNGGVSGSYAIVGRTVHVRQYWGFGTTTTYGTGIWRWGLPPGIVSAAVLQTGVATGLDQGTAFRIGTIWLDASATTFYVIRDSSTQWTNTVPHTWANTDIIVMSLTFEAAL